MRKVYGQDDEAIAEYVEEVFAPDDALLNQVRASAASAGLPDIHVAPMDGQHLEVLAAATGAKRAVEIGTLAGYSGIRLLRGMGRGGRLDTFELDPKHAEVARANFVRAGFSQESFHIWQGPALENLSRISGTVDLVFIDADKANYPEYFRWAAKNLKVGGLLLADNCFAFGTIAQKEFADPSGKKIAETLRGFNALVARHPEFRATMIPTGEGLLAAVRVRE